MEELINEIILSFPLSLIPILALIFLIIRIGYIIYKGGEYLNKDIFNWKKNKSFEDKYMSWGMFDPKENKSTIIWDRGKYIKPIKEKKEIVNIDWSMLDRAIEF